MLKTIACGDLHKENAGETVTLAGWVHRRRDHGGVIFIDLRDSRGLVQVVFNPDDAPEAHKVAEDLRNEWVIQVSGTVRQRPNGTENPNLETGSVEVAASALNVLNASKTPPFDVSQDSPVDEMLRMQYRYLDLRRPFMSGNIRLRHRVVKFIRDFLDERNFVEIETPILIKSTPEGARDYLVPSRVHPGEFYALPQSPQQLKQLLMVAGFEKYFQIARCFRDEDLRADRQPEFTQLDLELSFVEVEDVLTLLEKLYTDIVRTVAPHKKITTPFPRINYADAVERYGSDKPDLRFGLELAEFTDIVATSEFKVFSGVVASGGSVKGIAAPGMASISRRESDELINLARGFGAGGLVTLAISAEAASVDALTVEDVRSSAGRSLTIDEIKAIAQQVGAKPGDMVLIAAGGRDMVNAVLGQVRVHVAQSLGLADPNELAFALVVDFPLFTWNEDEDRWDSVHHPFTSPIDEHWDILATDPGAVRAKAYDLACNGSELAGGSIRVHRRDLQERIFSTLGYSKESVGDLFGHLLEAFEHGAPPHGGFASGIERLVVLLSDGAESIRDAMAFPKTQAAVDPLFGAPSPVSDSQLSDLHLRLSESALAQANNPGDGE